MNAIVLSPGPSLALYDPRPADLTVCVNRAALRWPCGAWACCDLPAIVQWHEQAIGAPVLIAGQEALDNLRDRQITWRGEVFDKTKLVAFLSHTLVHWTLFSFTTAVVYAAFRGATRIDVYGADWEGTADWDGVEAGKNRAPSRWELERGTFGALVKVLGERGITITRHVPHHVTVQ